MKKLFKLSLLALLLGLFCCALLSCKEKDCAHNYGEWQTTKQATCSIGGRRERKCSLCGKTEEDMTAILEHDEGDWVTTTEPTCAYSGVREKTCNRCQEVTVETLAMLTEHTPVEYDRREPTCTQKGYSRKTCACRKVPQYDDIPNLGGHKDEDENGVCDVCEEGVTRIPVELLCRGNASAEAFPYILISEESDGIIQVTMGENSIMRGEFLYFPSAAEDPSIVGGHRLDLSLDYIEADRLDALTGTYERRFALNYAFFGSPAKVVFEIYDRTETALVVVTSRNEQNPNGLYSSQVHLYWGNLVNPDDAAAMTDPQNQILVEAAFEKEDENASVKALRITDAEGNILTTQNTYTLVGTQPVTHLSIYYERTEKTS